VHATPAFIRDRFSFPSLYEPLSDAFAQRYTTYHETHMVHGQRYRPFMGSSRATLLLLHGWTSGEYRWEERVLIPWLCRECGYTVVALVQPYHGARKPANASFSGEFFISSDLVRLVEACRQSVIDTRTAFNWLLEETDGPVGIMGISLGAYMTYLLLCADERPTFAVPMLGHGELMNGPGDSSLTRQVRRGFAAQQIDPETVRPLTRAITALEMRPQVPPERILPVNGLYDTISTAERARRLFEAWEIPKVVWFAAGHFGIVHTRPFRRGVQDFVERWN
jgi:hypothetical protein